MPFNLLIESWLPVRLANGDERWISPAELFDAEDAVAPNWPRADFNTATHEFLIGLAAVALAPEDEDAWREVWDDPPRDWGDRLDRLSPAFNLDGSGPRFMQEFGGLEGGVSPVEALIIDTPGRSGQEKNADLLTRRNRYPALGLPAAAIALYALQSFAPSGGSGNRTGLRGGGPLTVLVLPQAADGDRPLPLWRRIWANVCPVEDPPADVAEVFPWLRPLPKVERVSETTPGFHPLHAFFGMPRRIWLEFGEGCCAITGRKGSVVSGFVQRPHGLNYDLWRHPLTPYRRRKEADVPYPAKPKSHHFGANDWVAAVVGQGPLREPAQAAKRARGLDRRDILTERGAADARLLAAGWAMNNMEAIAYLWAEMPLHLAPDEARARDLDSLALAMAETADRVANTVRIAVDKAYDRQEARGLVKKDTSSRSAPEKADSRKGSKKKAGAMLVESDVFARIDVEFHALLSEAMTAPSGPDGAFPFSEFGKRWLRMLRRTAFEVFDVAAPVPVHDPLVARDVVKARDALRAVLDGYRAPGPELYRKLRVPAPPARGKRKKREEPA